jgi:bifunctional non-homologous end joining protein LigD
MKRTDSLETYRGKRDFRRTPEPPGRPARRRAGRAFFIQKHAATRLHYDFRLEMDGVLKSWAVPKGPCLDPDVKRLAVHVEDHPLEYGSFEGTIPKGQYGAGCVLLWERGTWTPEGDPAAAVDSGKLIFSLHGTKLHGRWSLIRLAEDGKPGAKENWLLRKLRDADARPLADVDVLAARPESVRSPEAVGKKAPFPAEVRPQLATLVTQAPAGDDWVHEIKFDGYRFLAFVEHGKARLVSRNGRDWSGRLPALSEALAGKLPAETAILDGELVAVAPNGVSDFAALKDALGRRQEEGLLYFAFDLLYLDGRDLRDLPLLVRKENLRSLIETAKLPVLRYSDHVEGRGELFFKRSCEYALEGTVSKRKNAPYRSGRGGAWLKVKCQKRQEFVVVGYTDPGGSRRGLGALLLAVHEGNSLVYAGKVGTGFSADLLLELRQRLEKHARRSPPVDDPVPRTDARGAHWVEPLLVAEVSFSNWTKDRRLRHPSFLGLREDKSPKDVVREVPAPPPAVRDAAVAGLRLSHPERVLWPDGGLTKADLARYYEAVAPRLLPHVSGRLLSLVRCPDGQDKPCFYQKHALAGMPPSVKRASYSEKGRPTDGVTVEDLPGLIALAQFGVLEIHPWGSRLTDLEHPDRCTFDLDPGPGVAWEAVVRAAREVRAYLKTLKLESFVKTTGGKGLHVVVPFDGKADWTELKAFSKRAAEELARAAPDRYTARLSKSARPGKIFIDYLRNGRGATAVAPFSPRARPGAPVALPLSWDELGPSLHPERLTIRSLMDGPSRLRADPWRRLFTATQSVPRIT